MGKLLTRNELAAVSTLAAAIGIPLQTPDRGLLPGLLIAALVVVLQRTIAGIASKKERFERLTQGRITTLVSDSVLQINAMKECHLSRERISPACAAITFGTLGRYNVFTWKRTVHLRLLHIPNLGPGFVCFRRKMQHSSGNSLLIPVKKHADIVATLSHSFTLLNVPIVTIRYGAMPYIEQA